MFSLTQIRSESEVSANLKKSNFDEWRKKLRAAAKKSDFGGVLLLLDSDSKSFQGHPFCAVIAAKRLAQSDLSVGAGSQFSVVCSFASVEFESWFISAIAGFQDLPGGRVVRLPEHLPPDPEIQPLNAKGWMRSVVSTGYRPTHDQAVFAEKLNFDLLRENRNRSFQRLEHAVQQLIDAMRTGSHVVSPLDK